MTEIVNPEAKTQISHGEAARNRDIAVSKALLDIYPLLKPMLAYPALEIEFERYNSKATRRKNWFGVLGLLSLIFVCIVLILLSVQLALATLGITLPFFVEVASASFGIFAVVIQLGLYFTKLQEKWLFARYVAERIRLWKFQLFLDGAFISKFASITEDEIIAELDQRWAVFLDTFKSGGFGEMQRYIEDRSSSLIERDTDFTDGMAASVSRDAYRKLRIEFELNHFENKNLSLRSLDRITDSWARVFLAFSGVIAVSHVCFMVLQSWGLFGLSHDSLTGKRILATLAVAALAFGIVSAGVRVYRHATMIAEERERYRVKQTPLVKMKEYLKDESDPIKVKLLIKETELICIEELQDFVRVMQRASYFF